MHTTRLPDRGTIEISGPDRVEFLQGLVSNDVTKAGLGCCVWAALLTPQGRYRAEFFIFATATSLWLDAPREAIADVLARLSRFRLRSKVILGDRSDQTAVYAGWGDEPPANMMVAATDPRLAEAGWRGLARTDLFEARDGAIYHAHRLALGLPDHADLEPGETLLLEAGFDELNGIDFTKGCYMGQELTARTKYRGLVKRRLIPIEASTALPGSGSITTGGRDVGVIRSVHGCRGLAMLRIDALCSDLHLGSLPVTPVIPSWLVLPAPSETVSA